MDRREYQREWVAERRAAFFADKSCVRCGSTDRLRLDHVDPKQKVSHRIFSWAPERQAEELAKCQILCHDCHWDKTREDFKAGVYGSRVTKPCPSAAAYKRGCRCPGCRQAKALSRG